VDLRITFVMSEGAGRFAPAVIVVYFSRRQSASMPLLPTTVSNKTMSSEAENAPSSSGAAMLNQPIVMDCGTATIKAGFAGGTKPKVRLFSIMIKY